MTQHREQVQYPVITAVGGALPSLSLNNRELIDLTRIDSSPDWIKKHTGIERRHWAVEGEFASDLAVEAAKGALSMANLAPSDVSSIYVATGTPDYPSPNTASIVHDRLGAPEECGAVDVRAACAGFVAILQAASDGVMARPYAPNALVIGAELPSSRANWRDRRSVILFGDGAGAAMVQPRANANRPVSVLLTQPNREAIYIPAGGRVEPAQGARDPRNRFVMDGPTVKQHALSIMGRSAQMVARRAGLADARGRIDWDGIDLLVPHQANLRLIEAVGQEIGVPPEKCITTVQRHGNTSSASIPLALTEAHRQGKIGPERKRVLFTAVGAGMVGGAILMDVELPD